MSAEQGAALADFARTCKAAARAVSLYPGTHPAIAATLGRLVIAVGTDAHGGDLTLVVYPTPSPSMAAPPSGRTQPSENSRRCCTAG